ncbi:bifunctional phosphopantothenoylcysteine decarboxylase/phosphopantothenate--cysteine ligase CoaBC [Bacillaceae bacterium W0354]
MLKGKNVLLGVSGGIAAYKACALTSKLVQHGANVKVVMTKGATQFVQPLTFQALSRNAVHIDAFDEKNPEKIAHIDLADWADVIILAPATAHLIGKIANGLADDMLTAILLASTAPVYVAPAMNVHMYDHPSVKHNLKTLESYGYRFIEPGDGYLACGYVGKGRLEEPENIISVIESFESNSNLFANKKILITAGPTKESVDAVRFFTNHSSGKMGYALAEVARNFGGDVTLISGPVNLDPIPGVKLIKVDTAEEMYEAVHTHFEEQDLVIKSAAVADYRPKKQIKQKLKKSDGDLVIEMERTKDILKELGEKKQNQYLVGFAAETNDLYYYGKQKLDKKNLDAIVINDISSNQSGFQSDMNEVRLLTKKGLDETIPLQSKRQIAERLLMKFKDEMMGEGN